MLNLDTMTAVELSAFRAKYPLKAKGSSLVYSVSRKAAQDMLGVRQRGYTRAAMNILAYAEMRQQYLQALECGANKIALFSQERMESLYNRLPTWCKE